MVSAISGVVSCQSRVSFVYSRIPAPSFVPSSLYSRPTQGFISL